MNEALRLDALHQLRLLDTPQSESFDRITRLASQIFDLPIAAVSLTDSNRQWVFLIKPVSRAQLQAFVGPSRKSAS